jgi:hypothetical protein
MKASKMMRRVFSAVAVSNLALSAPVAAQDVDVAELESKASRLDRLMSRLKNYSAQRTYASGYKEGVEDQREIAYLNDKLWMAWQKISDEALKKTEQLGDTYRRSISTATSVNERNRLQNEWQRMANLLAVERERKKSQQVRKIYKVINIIKDARKLNLMSYEYESKIKTAPDKAEQLQHEFDRKFDTYLKEHGYAE